MVEFLLLILFHFSLYFALEDACGYLPNSNLQVKDFIIWIQQRSESCSTLWIHPGVYHITAPTPIVTSPRVWASTLQMLRLKHHIDDSLVHDFNFFLLMCCSHHDFNIPSSLECFFLQKSPFLFTFFSDYMSFSSEDYRIFGSTHLPFIFSLKNVVIEMTGVTFVMGDRSVGAIQISGWINVTLKGLTIEYANYPTNQARVDVVGVKGLEVTIPDGYPLDDWQSGKTFSCNVYLPGTRFLRLGASDIRPTEILQSIEIFITFFRVSGGLEPDNKSTGYFSLKL